MNLEHCRVRGRFLTKKCLLKKELNRAHCGWGTELKGLCGVKWF